MGNYQQYFTDLYQTRPYIKAYQGTKSYEYVSNFNHISHGQKELWPKIALQG
jgi:hypothetical protein